jgi:hypothetical protein
MTVEIGAEATLFPEKEYISGIFVEVQTNHESGFCHFHYPELILMELYST